jgi:type IX secretion system PorP/SprF family membrane protein
MRKVLTKKQAILFSNTKHNNTLQTRRKKVSTIHIMQLTMTVLLAVAGSTVNAQQQRIYNYNGYADDLTPVNAAHTLVTGANMISMRGNRQLIGIDGGPGSLMLSGHFQLKSIDASAGLYVMNEHIAVENQTEVNAFFAKAVRLTDQTYLSVALNAGFRNYVANYTQLDATDPQFSADVRETRPNLGFAVMLYSSDYYIGLSVPELSIRSLGTASAQEVSYLRSHYYLTGAYLLNLSEDVKVKPATMMLYTPGSAVLANLSGTLYLKEQLGLGINYRTDKTAAAMLSLITKSVQIGYSYQFGVSNTPSAINTVTHEVGISYRFGGTGSNRLL